MARRNNKHVLKAAKDQMTTRYTDACEDLQEEIRVLREDADNHTCAGYGSSDCPVCQQVHTLQKRYDEVIDEWQDRQIQARKNKKKTGKRVDWVALREARPEKVVNHDYKNEVRANRKEAAKPQFLWCMPGALVRRKDKKDEVLMVVDSRGTQAQVMLDGRLVWTRATLLRPIGD